MTSKLRSFLTKKQVVGNKKKGDQLRPPSRCFFKSIHRTTVVVKLQAATNEITNLRREVLSHKLVDRLSYHNLTTSDESYGRHEIALSVYNCRLDSNVPGLRSQGIQVSNLPERVDLEKTACYYPWPPILRDQLQGIKLNPIHVSSGSGSGHDSCHTVHSPCAGRCTRVSYSRSSDSGYLSVFAAGG